MHLPEVYIREELPPHNTKFVLNDELWEGVFLQVEVRVYGGLESCIPGTRFGQPIPVEAPEGANGYALLDKLKIPREKTFSFLINGVHKDFDTLLAEGDRVSIFPPLGGG